MQSYSILLESLKNNVKGKWILIFPTAFLSSSLNGLMLIVTKVDVLLAFQELGQGGIVFYLGEVEEIVLDLRTFRALLQVLQRWWEGRGGGQ